MYPLVSDRLMHGMISTHMFAECTTVYMPLKVYIKNFQWQYNTYCQKVIITTYKMSAINSLPKNRCQDPFFSKRSPLDSILKVNISFMWPLNFAVWVVTYSTRRSKCITFSEKSDSSICLLLLQSIPRELSMDQFWF